ncbi:mediator of RNA polymerase II transcription complex subunit 8-domain-containing protein [Dipodascopsis uninucleata]
MAGAKVDPAIDLLSVPVESLEAIRLRLSHLSHWLNHLNAAVTQSSSTSAGGVSNGNDPSGVGELSSIGADLPPWPSLQTQFGIVLKQLGLVAASLSQHSEVLQSTVAYPQTSFPVTTEAGLLATLLRKRVEPDVAEWIAQGEERGKSESGAGISGEDSRISSPLSDHSMKDGIWMAAREIIESERDSRAWDGLLTTDELRNSSPDTINMNETVTSSANTNGNLLASSTPEIALEQILRYTTQGIDVKEPLRTQRKR